MSSSIRLLILIIVIAACGFLAGRAFGAEPTATGGQPTLVSHYDLVRVTYDQSVCVGGGAGGARDYVGLYLSSAPTATRAFCGTPLRDCWLYLDGTKNVANAQRSLTGGCVTFTELTPGIPYEARFYRWTPADIPDELLVRLLVTGPILKGLEYRTMPSDGAVVVTRTPVGNRDEISIKRAVGLEERILIDRGVIFELNHVTDAPEPTASAGP